MLQCTDVKPAIRTGNRFLAFFLCSLLLSGSSYSQGQEPRDWLTWGGNPARSGWVKGGNGISTGNVAGLQLKWTARIEEEVPIGIESGASMLTAPLVVSGVDTGKGSRNLVFVLSFKNTLAALDAETGETVWRQAFKNKVEPAREASWTCTNTPTATPVIDKASGTIYFLTGDGALHGVSIRNGEDKIPPTDFVPPFSRNWSLNLVDGILYTTVGRGCGSGASPRERVAAHMAAMDLNDPARPVTRLYTSTGRPAGVWGRGGVAWGPKGLYGQTADGPWNPENNQWGQSLLSLAPGSLEIQDYFTPRNLDLINELDLDFGSGGPLAFSFENRELVAAAGKDGTVYLLDANSLGGPDHRTPLFELKIGNDANMYASAGVWGAMATARPADNGPWLYVPLWGPVSRGISNLKYAHGLAPDGSIMAFKVALEKEKPVLVPVWVSRNLSTPDPPLVVNDVVFAISTGENTIQRHTDPRYLQIYQRGGEPLSTRGILTAEERG